MRGTIGNRRVYAAMVVLGVLWAPSAVFGQTRETVPLPVERAVSFRKDVVPILLSRCARCHTGDAAQSGFRIDTRATFLAGGDSGEVVVAGRSAESYLVDLVAGLEPDRIMPAQGPRLTAEQVAVLRRWIDDGVPWDEGYDFTAGRRSQIAVHRPEVPPPATQDAPANPIDRILGPYLAERQVELAAPVGDALFARRAGLDLVGLLPTPEQLEEFIADGRQEKRAMLVERLLADQENYAVHWLTFWNDALRNAYRGTGYIDGGRKQITTWLYRSLDENKPLDRFVRELIDPGADSEGFIKGIKWRGVVNSSQSPEMQAAQNLAQVFLGTNLKCASCHDSFVNQWKLSDAYALAAVFAEQPLEVHRCNKPTGEIAQPGFIWPELGSIDPAAPRDQRMKQLAGIVSSPANGRLARTMVNRLWAWFFGRAIVEPVDDMDQTPFCQDLLDWLAADLQDHGYDLKHTMATIATSRAYQMPSTGSPGPEQTEFVFRGPLVRRMNAEQFVDAVSLLTGAWPERSPQVEGVNLKGSQERPGVRAALADADPLTRAMGRPNREQVVTRRDSIATTLEALELTNGATLDGMLARGAEHWQARRLDYDGLIEQIYRTALGHPPSEEERLAAAQLLGPAPSKENIHDFLWTVCMLPEFQLIY